jgi:hypothetical protein
MLSPDDTCQQTVVSALSKLMRISLLNFILHKLLTAPISLYPLSSTLTSMSWHHGFPQGEAFCISRPRSLANAAIVLLISHSLLIIPLHLLGIVLRPGEIVSGAVPISIVTAGKFKIGTSTF